MEKREGGRTSRNLNRTVKVPYRVLFTKEVSLEKRLDQRRERERGREARTAKRTKKKKNQQKKNLRDEKSHIF